MSKSLISKERSLLDRLERICDQMQHGDDPFVGLGFLQELRAFFRELPDETIDNQLVRAAGFDSVRDLLDGYKALVRERVTNETNTVMADAAREGGSSRDAGVASNSRKTWSAQPSAAETPAELPDHCPHGYCLEDLRTGTSICEGCSEKTAAEPPPA